MKPARGSHPKAQLAVEKIFHTIIAVYKQAMEDTDRCTGDGTVRLITIGGWNFGRPGVSGLTTDWGCSWF